MEAIFDALQDVPRAELVHEQLTMDLAQAPSLQDFECKIRNLKGNSSPGPSGLSYNMLKKAPKSILHEIYNCLSQFWSEC